MAGMVPNNPEQSRTIPDNPVLTSVGGGGYEWQFLMLEISGGFMIMRFVCGHTSTNIMGVGSF